MHPEPHPESESPATGLGIAGRLARRFLHSPLTPLLAIIGLLLGLAAIWITPKEEEPQIEVTFADIFIPFPGATPQEVEQLVTTPAEACTTPGAAVAPFPVLIAEVLLSAALEMASGTQASLASLLRRELDRRSAA